jgi:hypothetical protein
VSDVYTQQHFFVELFDVLLSAAAAISLVFKAKRKTQVESFEGDIII